MFEDRRKELAERFGVPVRDLVTIPDEELRLFEILLDKIEDGESGAIVTAQKKLADLDAAIALLTKQRDALAAQGVVQFLDTDQVALSAASEIGGPAKLAVVLASFLWFRDKGEIANPVADADADVAEI